MPFKQSQFLFLICALAAAGCASWQSPMAQASTRAKPFVAALAAYHQDKGDYPQRLDELRPRYVPLNVQDYDNRDSKTGWRLNYQRVDQSHFQLRMDSAPCSMAVLDEKGRVTAACGPNYQ